MMQPDASSDQHKVKPADEQPPRTARRPVSLIVLLLIGAALGAAGYRLLVHSPGAVTGLAPETAPHLVREGQRIRIPEGSALRGKLVIEAVREQEIGRALVLPAVVEPDPARLVKVLPPLAGRVMQLK